MASQRYAVLVASHSCEYVRQEYGGLGKVYTGFLSNPGEKWETFMVIDGEFPEPEEVRSYAGFVITGSPNDAHGDHPWILDLCRLVTQIYQEGIKLLGICFGHQLISRALGGKTRRALVGWEVGVKKITFSNALLSKPYAARLPEDMEIYEVHQDQVYELPPGAELLAYSENTAIEMFALGNNVLGIQGHPEFTEDVMSNILDFCYDEGMLKEDLWLQAKESMERGKVDRKMLQGICKSFLRGTINDGVGYSRNDFLQLHHFCHMVYCLQSKGLVPILGP